MNEKQIQNIIPQQPGESDASYQRLINYILSPCTTLKEYEPYLHEHHPKIAVKYRTLTTNSYDDKWKERIKKYTDLQDQEIDQEIQRLFKDLNTRGIHDMQTFLDDLEEVKNKEMQLFHTGQKKPSSVIFTLRQYIKCYRDATEIYYINSRHRLEPSDDNEVQQDPEEININNDLLDDDNMKNRLQILRDIMEGKQ
jgi:hypothetical protein